MIKKGIFGGTFDPIHNGHLYIAHEAINSIGLDKVIFMPSGNPPHKTEKMKTDANLRLKLVEMAVGGENKFSVSPYEVNSKGLSYTYKTMEYFKEIEPETDWYFITGSDCLAELDTWKSVDRILKACTLVVFYREGYNKEDLLKQKKRVEELYKTEIIFLDIKPFPVSSTEIRNRIRKHIDASSLMPSSVYNIILELKLYSKEALINVE